MEAGYDGGGYDASIIYIALPMVANYHTTGAIVVASLKDGILIGYINLCQY